ncbi:MAG: MarC family protein [Gammaproteobacteria bacterium]|nr:MarC family protein [Gammaproteobacteria bacterium]
MVERIVNTFILFFVVIDPVSLAPIFSALTFGSSESYKRRMAYKGVAVAGCLLFFFALVGDRLLRYLNITTPAFSIAGGILLFLLAIDMVFVRESGLRTATPSEKAEAEHRPDISVFPLAIPMIAGPGSLTTVLLLVGDQGLSAQTLISLLVVLVVLLITLGMLLISPQLTKVLGETGTNVIARVLGIVLAAMAVQFIINGMLTTFPGLGEIATLATSA